MTISSGARIPSVTLHEMGPSGPQAITSEEIFQGKKVVLFALPGAFTPTCSAKHLPGFVQQAAAIRAKGVDSIVCLSVNDAFVMGAWGEQQKAAEAVRMVADGSGDFTRAIGMELDLTERGFGVRSDRYAMIVDDGVVVSVHREAPGKFEVSSADAILAAL